MPAGDSESVGGDPWFEWLTNRRQGASEAQLRVVLEHLAPVREAVLAHAAVRAGDTLLDVGTGDGLIAFGALDRVGESGAVIFSDVSNKLLERCARQAGELGAEHRCRFVLASAEDLSAVADGSVDVVTTRSVLIYVKDKAAAFKEFRRVLRPGGRISIYEPINRLMHEPGCVLGVFGGYDLAPVAPLVGKLDSLFDCIQDPETDPMLDFDERDLLALAERAGFPEVHLELRVDVEPLSEPVPWETFLKSSGNPLVPTVGEAIDQVLTSAEAAELEACLRPLVEEGRGRRRMAGAHIWGTLGA